jgi:glucokinase
VLLGGGLGKAAYQALDLVTKCESPWFNYEVKAGELGDNAGVIGAGLRAFEA